MSEKRRDWLGWVSWLIDQFIFAGNSFLRSKSPVAEEEDAQNYEALRQQAREADKREQSTSPAKTASAPPHQKATPSATVRNFDRKTGRKA